MTKLVFEKSDDLHYLTDNPNKVSINWKTRAELAFEPRISLGEGLKRSLLWYRASDEDSNNS